MTHSLTILDVCRLVATYARLPSAQAAVLLPALLATGAWHCKHRPLPTLSGLLFLMGTALSVEFSVFTADGIHTSLNCLPGYTLVLMLAPPSSRPHWLQAYGIAFASDLTADLWCTFKHFYAAGDAPLEIFYGVGGAGFADGLFINPILCAVFAGVLRWLEVTGRGPLPLSACWSALKNRLTRERSPRPVLPGLGRFKGWRDFRIKSYLRRPEIHIL